MKTEYTEQSTHNNKNTQLTELNKSIQNLQPYVYFSLSTVLSLLQYWSTVTSARAPRYVIFSVLLAPVFRFSEPSVSFYQSARRHTPANILMNLS